MTRGTVLLIGRHSRESELFATRLEREHFQVDRCVQEGKVFQWLKKNPVRAILFTPHCSRRLIERIETYVHGQPKTKRLPMILLADQDVLPTHQNIKGIGEAFRFHVIPLAEAVRRLELAIQLSQLAAR